MAILSICSVEGCGKASINSRGWCGKHYQRWQRHGDPTVSKMNRTGIPYPCSVDGCGRPCECKRLCKMHYTRVAKGNDAGDAASDRGKRLRWVLEHAQYSGDDCLKWPFSTSEHGRGSVQFDNQIMSAPRAMCFAAYGPPPTERHEAAHSCGNGHQGCMNRRHLSWKTPKENEADKIAHGTIRRGEMINTVKLTSADVLAIRRRVGKTPGTELALEYGVSTSQISAIKNRQAWSWL